MVVLKALAASFWTFAKKEKKKKIPTKSFTFRRFLKTIANPSRPGKAICIVSSLKMKTAWARNMATFRWVLVLSPSTIQQTCLRIGPRYPGQISREWYILLPKSNPRHEPNPDLKSPPRRLKSVSRVFYKGALLSVKMREDGRANDAACSLESKAYRSNAWRQPACSHRVSNLRFCGGGRFPHER